MSSTKQHLNPMHQDHVDRVVAAKTVRNILANELGLSRENVLQIIEQRIDKLLGQQPIEKVINKAVENAVDRLIKGDTRGWSTVTLRDLVREATVHQLRENVQITVGMKA